MLTADPQPSRVPDACWDNEKSKSAIHPGADHQLQRRFETFGGYAAQRKAVRFEVVLAELGVNAWILWPLSGRVAESGEPGVGPESRVTRRRTEAFVDEKYGRIDTVEHLLGLFLENRV
jgi:hypothetical protein